ncbi:hypothetical protein SAMN05660649_01218 [Desulfotomaculum arcticum]|uniref:Uncharacterized protein n=1 Tax=Desulfotruncus arcticus DSM 17038 TaxID=1121424 RepID=A0A1I2QGN8_9FIRM|nr:hypothetical protein [Desulfotruncus arcticus]SFG27130.1 hypothetical protein SAMN05660649_01218 [Desulfotomaculum arcticum] [Desulfotruncus arcticus DSM 17038]
MSSVSQTVDKNVEWAAPNVFKRLIKSFVGFFSTNDVSKKARIWHGGFSYSLIPNTSIRNFHNMNPVTSIDAGQCYICVFDQDNYQGNYQMLGPGEKVQLNNCASLVVGTEKFSIGAVRNNAAPPKGFWEMDGPMYMAHFSSGYRYA